MTCMPPQTTLNTVAADSTFEIVPRGILISIVLHINLDWCIPNGYAHFTLSPCAVESHPTPGDSRGSSSSPSRSLSGVSSHVADGGSARIPIESVHPSLPWSSSVSRSIHSPEHHVIFHPSCSHHVSKVA